MTSDPKREVLRHALATIAFRGGIALKDAPADFAEFRVSESTRSPAEILAHIGDLIVGSHYLFRGDFIRLESRPLPWDEEIARFFTGVRELDTFLASDKPLAHSVEKMIQGPIGDALTHVGQIVMLRRIAGAPIQEAEYFTAEIVPGTF